jgi:hypothetical protein
VSEPWRAAAARSYTGCGLQHDYALLTLDRDIGNQVPPEPNCSPSPARRRSDRFTTALNACPGLHSCSARMWSSAVALGRACAAPGRGCHDGRNACCSAPFCLFLAAHSARGRSGPAVQAGYLRLLPAANLTGPRRGRADPCLLRVPACMCMPCSSDN